MSERGSPAWLIEKNAAMGKQNFLFYDHYCGGEKPSELGHRLRCSTIHDFDVVCERCGGTDLEGEETLYRLCTKIKPDVFRDTVPEDVVTVSEN